MVNVKGDEEVRLKETDSSYHITANGIQLTLVYYRKYAAAKAASPLTTGRSSKKAPIISPDFPHRTKEKPEWIRSTFDRKKSYNTLEWTIYPSG